MKDQQTFLPFMKGDGSAIKQNIQHQMEDEPDILKERQMKVIKRALETYLDIRYSSRRLLLQEVSAHIDTYVQRWIEAKYRTNRQILKTKRPNK